MIHRMLRVCLVKPGRALNNFMTSESLQRSAKRPPTRTMDSEAGPVNFFGCVATVLDGTWARGSASPCAGVGLGMVCCRCRQTVGWATRGCVRKQGF